MWAFLTTAGASLSLSVLLACSSTEPSERSPTDARAGRDSGLTPAPPTFEPTFAAIYDEVIAAQGCLLGLCHGSGASGGELTLTPRRDAYDRLLVMAPSSSERCGELGLPLVEPGQPESSLLWLKLQTDPPCGLVMPPDGPVDPRHLDQVRRWIERGAPP